MNTATNYDLKIKTRIKLVHIAASELRLLDPKRHNTDPDDDYHHILARWNRQGTRQPVTSSLQMTYQQLGELLDFFKGLGFKIKSRKTGVRSQNKTSASPRLSGERPSWKKYESSIQGLKDEICDLARARFGDAWELPLNNFCLRFGVRWWQWLDVSHGKAVKDVLLRLNRGDVACSRESAAINGDAEQDNEEVPF